MEYTIIGGQVNIASRLENLAEPDSVFISQATYALIQDVAVCEFVDNTSVKGIHYPIEIYRLTGMKDTQSLAASMLETTRSGFVLKELSYDATTSGAKERDAMRHALRRALDVLERSADDITGTAGRAARAPVPVAGAVGPVPGSAGTVTGPALEAPCSGADAPPARAEEP